MVKTKTKKEIAVNKTEDKIEIKSEQKLFEFKHQNGDVFTYDNAKHEYKLNGITLPGTTTPLVLVNEVSWDKRGNMSDKSGIIKNWAVKVVVEGALESIKKLFKNNESQETYRLTYEDIEKEIIEAKKIPNQRFKGAGVSGTEIHEKIEELIKDTIKFHDGIIRTGKSEYPQVDNFIQWSIKNKVKFLFSEEPIYSKEWMNCGTVDFVCEIDGKVLVGDIKTNGDKRRYEWDSKLNRCDYSKPVSDIHIPALWQTGAYSKMLTEDGARKLLDRVDGIVIVNIKKSGIFDPALDVRFDYNLDSLIEAYNHVIKLYKLFRSKIY